MRQISFNNFITKMGQCCFKDEENPDDNTGGKADVEAVRQSKMDKKAAKKAAKEGNPFNAPRGTKIDVDEEGKITKSAYKVPSIAIDEPQQPPSDEPV